MRDTTNQILNASLEVFKSKGYAKATTKEIARTAGVAEVTLYRQFNTKKALFEATLRKHLNLALEETDIDPKTPSETFIPKLLRNRLERMSRQTELISLLIRESLSDTLPEALHFDRYVEKRLKSIIIAHLEHSTLCANTDEVTRMIIGVLLSYVLIPGKESFHKMQPSDKDGVVNTYSKMILKAIESKSR